MPNKIKLAVLLLFSLTFFSCKESLNVDDQIFVLSIGIDEGQVKNYIFTFQMPKFGQEKESSDDSIITMCVEANNIFEGVDLVNAASPAKLNFTHLNYVVVSQTLAKKNAMREILSPFPRLLHIRQTVDVFVAKQSSQKFLLGLSEGFNENYAKMQKNLVAQQEQTGLYPKSILTEFYDGASSGFYDSMIPIGSYNENIEQAEITKNEKNELGTDLQQEIEQDISFDKKPVSNKPYVLNAGEMKRSGGLKSEIYGCAIFKNTKMVGEFNGEETQILLIGKGVFNSGFFSIEQKDGTHINLQVSQERKPKVSLDLNQKPIATIIVFLQGDIYQDNSETSEFRPFYERVNVEESSKKVAEFFLEKLNDVSKKCNALESDAFEIGRKAVQKFKYLKDWEKYDWQSRIKDLEIVWKVEFTSQQSKKNE